MFNSSEGGTENSDAEQYNHIYQEKCQQIFIFCLFHLLITKHSPLPFHALFPSIPSALSAC